MPDETNNENRIAEKKSATLYVVLHGELAIFDGTTNGKPADSISVYTPDLIEHVYMAGPWKGEQRIPPGATLELIGASSGRDTIANYREYFLALQGGCCNPSSSYMEIRLPRPRKIWPANLNALQPGQVTLSNKPVTPGVSMAPPPELNYSPNISMCCVFEYAVVGQYPPFLKLIGGPAMDTFPTWGAGIRPNNSYSLHLFAEGDAIENLAHAIRSFGLAAQILGATATLAPIIKAPGPVVPAPPDLLPEETSITLAERVYSMGLPARLPMANVNNEYTCGQIVMLS